MNSPHGVDIYRINDLIKTGQVWQPAAVLQYASSAHPSEPARDDVDGRMRARGEKIYSGATPPVGLPDALYGDLSN